MINEPVYVGDKSGLEFSVMKDGQPVTGLETSLKATTTYNGQTRDLPINARDGADGWYESFFIPTAVSGYTFHIFGTIESTAFSTRPSTPHPTGTARWPRPRAINSRINFRRRPSSWTRQPRAPRRPARSPSQSGSGAAGLVVGLIAVGLSLAGGDGSHPDAGQTESGDRVSSHEPGQSPSPGARYVPVGAGCGTGVDPCRLGAHERPCPTGLQLPGGRRGGRDPADRGPPGVQRTRRRGVHGPGPAGRPGQAARDRCRQARPRGPGQFVASPARARGRRLHHLVARHLGGRRPQHGRLHCVRGR